ncbi:hypothetical protein NP493_258g05004 [Ridgeia piscesae]|uniref:Uncharacterized protein n=1 Tax=Ridgeia piscesae TaxID=27915 RepID=A0AAD9NY72_RIDPI|nr:hypothetical protein NP493_258g05004 [Ridgeia piscesae]
MGKYGIGKRKSNGELIVMKTMFKQKDERKTTCSRHWHMIDFIITRCRDKMDIHSTRAMRGANCWTDHQMLRSKMAFRIRQKHNRQRTMELQRAANRNDMKRFYNVLEEVWGPQKKGPIHLKSTYGMGTFSNSKRVVARRSEHFQKLLNVPGDVDHKALDNILSALPRQALMRFHG